MVFSDTTTNQGIVQEADFIASSNPTSFPIADKVRSANRALDKVVSLVLGADGRWQFDDNNQTDLPIGTTNLISGQQDYSFDSEFLVITRVEAKDSTGQWQRLVPFDQNDLNTPKFNVADSKIPGGVFTQGQSLTDFMGQSGTPLYYDKLANSIFLYPKPNYNSTAGLKVYFQRKPVYFDASDTIKQPGFAFHLHNYIPLSMAYDYALAKGLKKANQIRQEMLALEASIVEFYTYRPKDEQVVINPHVENWR